MIKLNLLMIKLTQMLLIVLILFLFGCTSQTQTEKKDESSFIQSTITREIVKNSIDKFLERTDNLTKVSFLAEYNKEYSNYVALSVTSTNASIYATFAFYFMKNWRGFIFSDEHKNFYNRIKADLSNVSHLKSIYNEHKKFAINYITSKRLNLLMKERLDDILPFLKKEIDTEVLSEIDSMIKKETVVYKGRPKEEWEELAQWKISLKKRGVDYLAYQWIKRREKEGGAELVNAWIEIISDFKNSL